MFYIIILFNPSLKLARWLLFPLSHKEKETLFVQSLKIPFSSVLALDTKENIPPEFKGFGFSVYFI